MEYWVAATEVMIAPDGANYPDITSGIVSAEGVEIAAASCVSDLVADELERRGIPIRGIVYTDGEPLVMVPFGL